MERRARALLAVLSAAALAACASDPFYIKDERPEPRALIRQRALQGTRRVMAGTYAECYRAAVRALDASSYYSVSRDRDAVYADEFHGMSGVGIFLRPGGREDRTQLEVLYVQENQSSIDPFRRRRAEEAVLDDVERQLSVARGEVKAEPRPALDRARARGIPVSEVDSVEGLPVRRRPLDSAIVIGAERHARLGDADYAFRDAEAFRRHAQTLLGVPGSGVVFLGNRTATREEILGAIENLRRTSQPGSRVWFYFAGHGALDPASGAPYLATWELEPRYWATSGVSLAELFRALEEVPAYEVVAIIDASFSGFGDRTWHEAAQAGAFAESRPEPSRASRLKVVYAASPGQAAGVIDDFGHGLFTYELLRVLGERSTRSGQRLDDAMSAVWRAVRARARSQGRAQDPRLSGGGLPLELW